MSDEINNQATPKKQYRWVPVVTVAHLSKLLSSENVADNFVGVTAKNTINLFSSDGKETARLALAEQSVARMRVKIEQGEDDGDLPGDAA